MSINGFCCNPSDPIELRRIGWEKLGADFVSDAAMPVVAAVPDAEYIAAAGRQHAIRLAVGFLLVGEELSAELASHRIEAGVGKRQCHRIGVLKLDRLSEVKLLACDVEHRRVEVGRNQPRRRPQQVA